MHLQEIIGFKIIFTNISGDPEYNVHYKTMRNTHIRYINIHGEIYDMNINLYVNEFYTTFGILDIIDYPFYTSTSQELICTYSYSSYNTSTSNNTSTFFTIKNKLQRRVSYGKLIYIKKSFILPKYLLNILLELKLESKYVYSQIQRQNIIHINCNYNNIYINFMKYIINKNDKKYNSLFYNIDDLEKIDDIDTINKKEIDEYYDNIEKYKLRQEELKQEELKQEELKQEELNRIAKETQYKYARGNITIENNTLFIEYNKNNDINLCDFLPYKTKKICNKDGQIYNIKYTEITHISFRDCQFTSISKYFTGITHLILQNCPNVNIINKELRDEIKYLQINDEILIYKLDDTKDDDDDIEDDDNDNATMSL